MPITRPSFNFFFVIACSFFHFGPKCMVTAVSFRLIRKYHRVDFSILSGGLWPKYEVSYPKKSCCYKFILGLSIPNTPGLQCLFTLQYQDHQDFYIFRNQNYESLRSCTPKRQCSRTVFTCPMNLVVPSMVQE